MRDLAAAVVQVRSTPDFAASVARTAELTQAALEAGAHLVAVPENYAGIAPAGAPPVHRADPVRLEEDPAVAPFVAMSRQHPEATVVLGGLAVGIPGSPKIHNTLLVVAGGQICASYAKVHCFEATMPDGRLLSELDLIVPGDQLVVADLPRAKLGLSICYDLRFPELYRALVDGGAEVLTAPSAFTFATGAAHWELLNRARAVENQCFMIAPAQWGVHAPGRHSWGHAMIVDPWGTVVAQVSDGEGWSLALLRAAVLDGTRRALPALAHRRLGCLDGAAPRPRETFDPVPTLTESESER